LTKFIYALFFAGLATIMIRQPAAAAGALLCTWALDQWARSQDAWFFANHGITSWLNSLLVVVALGLRVVKGKPAFKPLTREYFLMCGIFGFAALSVLWSIRPQDTVDQLFASYRTMLVFGFLMPLVISDLDDLRVTIYTILSVGTTISILVMTMGEWQGRTLMFQVGSVLAEQGLERGNPLAIAGVAGYVALIAMLMNFRGKARFWQIVRYAVIALAFALSVKSGSRGQTVSIIFCVVCLLPYSRRFKDINSFLALALSIAIFSALTLWLLAKLTTDENTPGVGDRWSWEGFVGSYEEGRVNQAMRLLSAWAAAGPLAWFIGLGSSGSFDPAICGFYPHVVFAEVLGELGIVGWIMLWLFPIFAFQNLRELWGYVKDDPEDRGLIATLGGLILFEIMMSFKQGSLLGSHIAFAFIIMLGRVTVTLRQQHARYQMLDAGMYPMSPTDWDDTGESYDEMPAPAGLAGAHRNG
jgi:hypothetical protein